MQEYEEYEQIDSFSEQINELIQQEVENKNQKLVGNLEYYRNRNKELTEKLYKEQIKNKTFEKLMEQKLVEQEREIKRSFCNGFAVNDTVYYVMSDRKETKCDKCNAKGEVNVEVLGKEVQVKCPYCSYGRVFTYHYYPKKTIIRDIKLYLSRKDSWDKKSSGVVIDNNIEVWLNDVDYSKKITDLYKTEEECQVVCDERNNKTN